MLCVHFYFHIQLPSICWKINITSVYLRLIGTKNSKERLKLQPWQLLHTAIFTTFLHYSITLQLTANKADWLFLLLISNILQPHFYPKSPNLFPFWRLWILVLPPIGTSDLLQLQGKKTFQHCN